MSTTSGDEVGDARDEESKARDAASDARDLMADQRDAAADRQDVVAVRADDVSALVDEADRLRYPEDRADSARLRELAAGDRQMAQSDRNAAHSEWEDPRDASQEKAEERERRAYARDVAAADRDDERAQRDLNADALDESFAGMAQGDRARHAQAREDAHDRRSSSAGDRQNSADDRLRAAAAHNQDIAALARRTQDDPLTGLAGRARLEERITELVDVTVEGRQRAALAALVADNAYDVVLRIRDGKILWVSPSLTRELGWAPEDWIDHHIYEFLLPDDQRAMALDQAEAYAKETALGRIRLRDKNDKYHHVETHTREVRTDAGEPDGLVTTFRTIDAEVRAEAELDRRVKLDDLTGALKRDAALAELSAILSRVRRSAGQHTALAFCDVDDFKAINDAHGHTGGDEWLAEAARRIAETIRSADILARMGGDEFLIVLDGVHDLAEATAIATKITAVVSQPITIDGEPVIATMSVGVTLAGATGTDRRDHQPRRPGHVPGQTSRP